MLILSFITEEEENSIIKEKFHLFEDCLRNGIYEIHHPSNFTFALARLGYEISNRIKNITKIYHPSYAVYKDVYGYKSGVYAKSNDSHIVMVYKKIIESMKQYDTCFIVYNPNKISKINKQVVSVLSSICDANKIQVIEVSYNSGDDKDE